MPSIFKNVLSTQKSSLSNWLAVFSCYLCFCYALHLLYHAVGDHGTSLPTPTSGDITGAWNWPGCCKSNGFSFFFCPGEPVVKYLPAHHPSAGPIPSVSNQELGLQSQGHVCLGKLPLAVCQNLQLVGVHPFTSEAEETRRLLYMGLNDVNSHISSFHFS